MERTYPKLVSDIIAEALKREGVTSTFNEHQALYLWPEIVGKGVNRYTSRRTIESGTMHVWLTSAPLKQELSYNRATLVEQINAAVGAHVIDDIKFH